MKKPLLLFFMLTGGLVAYAQTQVPEVFTRSFRALKLDRKYQLSGFIKPSFQQADFNGDGKPDVAALVTEKGTGKKGFILIHGGTNQYFVFGAGMNLAGSGDNYKWLNGWSVYRKKIAYETLFDNEGDMTGSRAIKIKHPGLEIYSIEDGAPIAGYVIYWDGKKYSLVHNGE